MLFRRWREIIPGMNMPGSEDLPNHGTTTDYDVVIIGGALSGAATANLLLRQNPGIRLLIVEKSHRLTRWTKACQRR